MSQIAASEIRVINCSVRRQSYPSWASSRSGQSVFVNFHRQRVYAGQLVGAELAKERRVVLRDHDTVRHSVRSRDLGQSHFAGFRVESPDIVGLFVGKPQNAVVIEGWCVWINLRAVVGTIFRYLARLWIKLADIAP